MDSWRKAYWAKHPGGLVDGTHSMCAETASQKYHKYLNKNIWEGKIIALVRGMLNLFLRRKKVRNDWITGYCRLQRTHWFCPQTLGKRRAHFSAAFGGAFQKRQAFLANHAVFGLWIQISEEPAPKLGCNFWELCLHMALSPKIIKMQGKDDALQRHVCA